MLLATCRYGGVSKEVHWTHKVAKGSPALGYSNAFGELPNDLIVTFLVCGLLVTMKDFIVSLEYLLLH